MSRSDADRERDRDDRGQYAETITPGDVLAVFQDREDPFEPLTAREVADVLDCDRKTAYNKLTTLSDRETSALETKKIGARARVWWHSPPLDELARRVGDQRLGDTGGAGGSDVSETSLPSSGGGGDETADAVGTRESRAEAIDVEPDESPGSPAAGSEASGTAVETAIANADLPGSGAKLDARRDALRAVVAYLREHGTATPADFRSDVYPDHPAGYTSGKDPARSWWKNALYPALREVADATGVIRRADTGGGWSWIGDDVASKRGSDE